jgi:hypothetical protein
MQMLTLENLFVLMLVATAGAWLWHNHGLREKALERVKQHCAKLDLELLDDAVALKRIAFVRDANGRKRLARIYAFEFTVTGEQRHPAPSPSSAPTACRSNWRPTRSKSRPHHAPTTSSRCSSGARSTTAGATDQLSGIRQRGLQRGRWLG